MKGDCAVHRHTSSGICECRPLWYAIGPLNICKCPGMTRRITASPTTLKTRLICLNMSVSLATPRLTYKSRSTQHSTNVSTNWRGKEMRTGAGSTVAWKGFLTSTSKKCSDKLGCKKVWVLLEMLVDRHLILCPCSTTKLVRDKHLSSRTSVHCNAVHSEQLGCTARLALCHTT